ncbi:short-chain dehydrogenase/reductase SDR (plasmid) [Calothrix sp. NIES-4071]|nr:short-chain dehydrogenase/reductase SDR [Calothrix sp. NIES-4071]BAZ65010.1 short-chain dehydrogenase/reductase SDR [Calothrix sp. NIES-4105]
MNIKTSIALVTGANRGIGKAIVEALCCQGVKRIYATARDINSLKNLVSLDPQKIIPIELDVTKLEQVLSVAELAQNVNVLINNAGVLARDGFFSASSVENARWEMETNFYGTLHMIRAFAPILGNNGGGAIINLVSLVSHVNVPMFGTYSASKAAALSLTIGSKGRISSPRNFSYRSFSWSS